MILAVLFQNCAPQEASEPSRSPASDFRDYSELDAYGLTEGGSSGGATARKESDPFDNSGASCARAGSQPPLSTVKPRCSSDAVLSRRSNFRAGNQEAHLIRVFQGSELSGQSFINTGSITVQIGHGETDVHLILMAYQPIRWVITGYTERVKKVELDGHYCHQIEGVDSKKIHEVYKYASYPDELNFTSATNRYDGGLRSVERIYGITLTSVSFTYDARCADNQFYVR